MVPIVTLERFKKRTKMASGTWDVNQGQGWGTKGVELRTKEGDGLAPERKMTRKNDGKRPRDNWHGQTFLHKVRQGVAGREWKGNNNSEPSFSHQQAWAQNTTMDFSVSLSLKSKNPTARKKGRKKGRKKKDRKKEGKKKERERKKEKEYPHTFRIGMWRCVASDVVIFVTVG